MYFYEKLDKNHEVRGIYQDIVDCVYIITMKNNKERRKLFLKELQKVPLHSNIIIVNNGGYKEYEKYLFLKTKIKVENSIQDITHANISIFEHAEKNNYDNILILEDDFRFCVENIASTQSLHDLNNIISHEHSKVISLGCIPFISKKYDFNFLYNIYCIGAQAHIYKKNCREEINNFIQKNILYDWDGITGTCGRVFYNKVLIYQIYQKDDWKKWGNSSTNKINNFMNRNFIKIIGPIVCMVGSDLEKIKKYYKYQQIPSNYVKKILL